MLIASCWLALCWAALTGSADAVEPELRLERVGLDDGLSQASVYAVLRDHRGLVWIGTQDGLNRYDGYSIRVFQRDSNDPDSLSDNFVTALQEGLDGEIWIGTWAGGLNRYDPATGHFRRYQHRPDATTGPVCRRRSPSRRSNRSSPPSAAAAAPDSACRSSTTW